MVLDSSIPNHPGSQKTSALLAKPDSTIFGNVRFAKFKFPEDGTYHIDNVWYDLYGIINIYMATALFLVNIRFKNELSYYNGC